MSKPEAFGTGEAVVGRMASTGNRPTWDEAKELADHPVAKLTRTQLVDVIAYLGVQLYEARTSVNADAALAMTQIQRIVNEFQQRSAA